MQLMQFLKTFLAFLFLFKTYMELKKDDFFRLMDTVRVVFFNKIVSSPDFI